MSDNLDVAPVTRIEGTRVVPPIKNDTTLNAIYTDQNIYNWGIHGPFNQTLFLGCSIVNFNVNLGWGAENSSLTVSLVNDDSPHWTSLSTNTSLEGFNLTTYDAGVNSRENFNIKDENVSNKVFNTPPNPVVDGNDPNNDGGTPFVSNKLANEKLDNKVVDFLNPLSVGNPGKELHMDLFLKEKQTLADNKTTNTLLNSSSVFPKRPDFGKVYYELLSNGSYNKKYWTSADPGFVGEVFDILGCPVRFIFNDFEFVGLITSWKNNGGQGGNKLYTVEIKSFASLLSNTQLIIDHYHGTIFKKFDKYPNAFNSVGGLGLPSNDIGNRYGRVGSPEYLSSFYNIDEPKYSGTISQGNLPNVFNIYGYLETTLGFGKSNINEEGTVINDIIASMKDLINYTNNDGSVKYMDKRFSPYGRIVGRAPAVTKLTDTTKLSSLNPNILFLKDQYTLIKPQNCSMSGIKEVAIPNATTPPFAKQTIVTNTSIKLNEMGLLPCDTASDGIIRSLYTINIDDLPTVPSGQKIVGPVISIMDLIQRVCAESNYDFFVDFQAKDPNPNSYDKTTNQIKIRTVERKSQPPSNYIQQLISSASTGSILTSYDYGKEFRDDATVRSLYIGAKQKRLLQVNSNFLANKNNSLVYDPYDGEGGRLLQHDINTIINGFRIPNHYSVRNQNFPYYKELFNATIGGSGTGAIIWEDVADWSEGTNCGAGNYLDYISHSGANINASLAYGTDYQDLFQDLCYIMYSSGVYAHTSKSNLKNYKFSTVSTYANTSITSLYPNKEYYNYPLWDDFICPYFGLDIDGNARKVFYDTGMRQLQVMCSVGDLQNILGFALTSVLDIKEEVTDWKTEDIEFEPDNNDVNFPEDESRIEAQLVGAKANASQAGTLKQRNIKWNLNRRDYYKYDTKFLLTENEIRAAMAGFDSWIEYTFNATFTTDLAQILRKTICASSGQLVQQKDGDNIDEITRINLGLDYPLVMIYHGPDSHLINSPNAENPTTSKWGMLTEKIKDSLEAAHQYVANIGNTYYGKQFMVKIPGLSISRDKPKLDKTELEISKGSFDNLHKVKYEGGGIYYSNYKPSTDGAWEEVGNVIDDTLIIGSISGDFFRENDGKISAILGYKGSYEYLRDTIPDEEIEKHPSPDTSAQGANTDAGELADFMQLNPSSESVDKPGGTAGRTLLDNTLNNTTMTVNKENIGPTIPTPAIVLSQASQPATGTDIIPNEWYPSVITNLSSDKYLFYPYNYVDAPIFNDIPSFGKDKQINTATYNNSIPDGLDSGLGSNNVNLVYKLYAKASIQENFEFINALQSNITNISLHRAEGKEPRAILILDEAITLNPVHLVDKYLHYCLTLDSMLFKTEGVSIPNELKKYSKSYKTSTANLFPSIHDGFIPHQGGFALGQQAMTLSTDHLIASINSASRTPSEDKANTLPIAPRAAMPGFAAVPLENQGSVYGPWTNHPYLVRRDIFTDPDIYDNAEYTKQSIENLVGGLKVSIEEDLAPWKYGSMRTLDEAVIARIMNDANYQLEIEYGSIDIPGSPIYKLGDFLDNSGDVTGGPVINSIITNIDKGGVSTKYNFRTFSKKFGLYNKENADRLAKINSESLSRRKQLASQVVKTNNALSQALKKQNLNAAPTTRYVNPPIVTSWRSASELLVGHNEITFRATSNGNQTNNLSGLMKNFDYDYSWGFHPRCNIHPSGGIYNVLDYPKFISNAKVMDSRESPKTLCGDYENTSFMSLDGLLSPISFYPTENFRTYHITKYPRQSCRFCLGVGKIKYNTNQKSIGKVLNITDITDLSYNKTKQRDSMSIDCPFCEPISEKTDKLFAGSSRGRITPPFVLTSGSDPNNTQAGTKNDLQINNTNGTTINYSTLNPVVLSFGEFSAFQNRQKKDFTGHSIKMIGQGTIPPDRPNDSFNQQYCADDRLYKSFLEYDALYLDKILELNSIPESERTANINTILSNITNPPRHFSNNSRFFGFRGPMMMHGWGYDTEGYPVPNSSGELKYNILGGNTREPIRWTSVDPNNPASGYVYKNQEFIEAANGSNEAKGKIIVEYSGKEGYWTDPFKESTFAMGWAQTPSNWPVGPIDLRWDDKAKLWTIPSTYKNVYILLEEDLNKNIARGEMIDNSSTTGNNPMLALGYRKVVFVRDTMGIYKAPRSAVVYCAYDSDSGYYEPVSQSSFTTSGIIISANAAQIYKLYQSSVKTLSNTAKGNDEEATYVASYSNPLDLSVSPGDMVLLTYLNNGWIVQSSRG